MRIRLITSFRLNGIPDGLLAETCDRLRHALRFYPVTDIRVLPDSARLHVEFTVDAMSFNDGNVRSGRILLLALHGIGVPVGDPEDIGMISTLDELNDADDGRLLEQSRRLHIA